jgi:hypothetical protein
MTGSDVTTEAEAAIAEPADALAVWPSERAPEPDLADPALQERPSPAW